jgi:tetratricopeptide (TPR) repeat protein
VQAPERELYDESTDPNALHNLAPENSAVANTLAEQTRELRAKTAGISGAPKAASSDLAEKLAALGYVASSNPGPDKQESLIDPKDKIEIANLLHEGLLAGDDQRYDAAVLALQQVLKSQPDIAVANLELGTSLNRLAKFEQAVPWLRKAVELSPQSGKAHYELATALQETGDLNEAAQQCEAAVKSAPDSDDVHFELGNIYEQLGRVADAKQQYEAALQINPNQFQSNLMLGRLLGMNNEPAKALPYLEHAVKLQADSADAHKFLANVYTELGQTANARREQAKLDRLQHATH